jgi:hypothetical protein
VQIINKTLIISINTFVINSIIIINIVGSHELVHDVELEELEHLDLLDVGLVLVVHEDDEEDDEEDDDDKQSVQEISDESNDDESVVLLTLIHFLKLESIDLIHSFIKDLEFELDVLLHIFALPTSLFLINFSNSTDVSLELELLLRFLSFLLTSNLLSKLDNKESSDSLFFF